MITKPTHHLLKIINSFELSLIKMRYVVGTVLRGICRHSNNLCTFVSRSNVKRKRVEYIIHILSVRYMRSPTAPSMYCCSMYWLEYSVYNNRILHIHIFIYSCYVLRYIMEFLRSSVVIFHRSLQKRPFCAWPRHALTHTRKRLWNEPVVAYWQ